MGWIWAALMPHPPVLVPEVGKGRERDASLTLDGLDNLLRRVQALPKPDWILLLSPHQPYIPGGLVINRAGQMAGSFSRFNAPEVVVHTETPSGKAEALAAHLERSGITSFVVENRDLTPDHGSMVPLYFLSARFEGSLPPTLITSPVGLNLNDAFALGRALRDFGKQGRGALLASGDLSHKLLPGGPNGYSPDGAVFDLAVVEALGKSEPERLLAMPRTVIHNAGECGLRSVLALLGLGQGPVDVCSYEAPFGVGYCTAFLSGETQ